MKINFNKNQGNALIMTIIVTLMFFIFAGSLLSMAMFSNNTNTNIYEREQARIVARSTVLSLKEYMEREGDKSFTTVGVPTSGGASNIYDSMVYINTDSGSLGEANNIRVNVVDKSSSLWEVTIWATGHYPNIESSTSGVDASVTFDMPKSSNKDGVLSDFNNNVLNSLNGDINISGRTIVAGGLYAGDNINILGSAYFPRSPEGDGNYIKAGNNINITNGSFRFDIDGIEAGGKIGIGGASQDNWPVAVLNLQEIGITTPPSTTNSFNNTVFKTPVQFETIWVAPFFEDGNTTLIHTTETTINTLPTDMHLELREVATVNDLDLLEPVEISINELPNGKDFPVHDINSGIDITENVRLTGNLFHGNTITIDASQDDIVIYIDTKVEIQQNSYIIINDGRDHTGEISNSVVFIIEDGGELIFNGGGTRLNNIYNTEIPQAYFISDSYSNILSAITNASVKGFIIAPNSTVTLNTSYERQDGVTNLPNLHGFVIANEINFVQSYQFLLWGDPIESTMDRVTSRYIREVRGGSNG